MQTFANTIMKTIYAQCRREEEHRNRAGHWYEHMLTLPSQQTLHSNLSIPSSTLIRQSTSPNQPFKPTSPINPTSPLPPPSTLPPRPAPNVPSARPPPLPISAKTRTPVSLPKKTSAAATPPPPPVSASRRSSARQHLSKKPKN